MNLNQKIVVSNTVFTQEIDGEMVLFDMNSENYFGLDAIGTDIWQSIQEKESLQGILEALLERYDVEESVLREDMIAFVKELQKYDLVSFGVD